MPLLRVNQLNEMLHCGIRCCCKPNFFQCHSFRNCMFNNKIQIPTIGCRDRKSDGLCGPLMYCISKSKS